MQKALEQTSEKISVIDYIVCEEEHKDGSPHLHGYFLTDKKFDIINPHRLDLVDQDGKTYHGNYQTVRSAVLCKKYCKKGKRYITNMKFSLMAEAIALAQEGKGKEAFNKVVEARPDMILVSGGRVKANISMLAEDNGGQGQKFGMDDFVNIPTKLALWQPERHALWLSGPTGTGKTELAKAHFQDPLLIRHVGQLKSIAGHDGLVFDDFNPSHWPRECVIHLTDLSCPSGINVKFSHVVIPAGMPRIFTSNTWIWPHDSTGAIERRVFAVQCPDRMYEPDIIAELQQAKAPDDWQAIKDKQDLDIFLSE